MKNKKSLYFCHRCGARAFEFLETYGHCVSCLDVRELNSSRNREPMWADEYRSLYSDQTSYQDYLINQSI